LIYGIRTNCAFFGQSCIPVARYQRQAQESTLQPSPSPTRPRSPSRSVPPSAPPSVSAYIPTSALPYAIPYTTTQEPSAQATIISPEAAAGYETATAVATMRPL
jgi:hypothetical protein